MSSHAPRPLVATLVILLFGWLLGGLPDAAEARSGGSGGGFSRSSGSSSSGGSRSSSGGSRSSYGGSGYRGTGPSGPMGNAIVVLFVLLFVFGIVRAVVMERRAKLARQLHVGRVQLGFDAPSCKGLRAAIEAMVRQGDPSTALGIWRLSENVLGAAALHADAVRYAHVLEKAGLDPDRGESEFHALATQARAFFDREIIRKDAAGLVETKRLSDKANALTDEDGDFGIDELFVVTLVIAVQKGALGLPKALTGIGDVKAALATMKVGQERVVGFEVIWTPAAESDILGRDELLVAFPELAPL